MIFGKQDIGHRFLPTNTKSARQKKACRFDFYNVTDELKDLQTEIIHYFFKGAA